MFSAHFIQKSGKKPVGHRFAKGARQFGGVRMWVSSRHIKILEGSEN